MAVLGVLQAFRICGSFWGFFFQSVEGPQVYILNSEAEYEHTLQNLQLWMIND